MTKKTIELSARTKKLMAEFIPTPPKKQREINKEQDNYYKRLEKNGNLKRVNTTTPSNSLTRSKSAIPSQKLIKNFVPSIPTKITSDMDLTAGYFDCMNACCHNKVGGKISRKAQFCSLKKSVFAQKRAEELSKLLNAYGQMGVSLGNLLNRNFERKE